MTIKELKERYPQDEYCWRGANNNKNNKEDVGIDDNDYADDDIAECVIDNLDSKNLTVVWHRPTRTTKPTLSKDKLDKVIELNRTCIKTPLLDREEMYDELTRVEKDCGEEIYDTSLLDIVSVIVLSTKAHDTPNETIYKVFEALGYEII